MLICPNCKQKLNQINNTFKCKNLHSFDISKEGYVNLLLPNMISNNSGGDNKEMINARQSFLSKGYFSILSNHLNEIIQNLNPNNILDCGCGEGYYSINLKRNFPNFNIVGIDISKFAISRAAKKEKNILFIVSSTAHLPIVDKSIDLILNIFAPHFNEEFSRCLKDNGFLIKVVPGIHHLRELKEVLYSNPYYIDDKKIELKSFCLLEERNIEYEIYLDKENIINLFKMTPYYYKTSLEDKNKLLNVDHLKMTIHFNILLYKNSQVT